VRDPALPLIDSRTVPEYDADCDSNADCETDSAARESEMVDMVREPALPLAESRVVAESDEVCGSDLDGESDCEPRDDEADLVLLFDADPLSVSDREGVELFESEALTLPSDADGDRLADSVAETDGVSVTVSVAERDDGVPERRVSAADAVPLPALCELVADCDTMSPQNVGHGLPAHRTASLRPPRTFVLHTLMVPRAYDAGSTPVKQLRNTFMIWRLVMLPHDAGSDPLKRFSSK
jgi:hypothetical protein